MKYHAASRFGRGLVIAAAFMALMVLSAQAAASEAYAPGDVSYLGPEGTYTQEAAECFFGGDRTMLPRKTVTEAVQEMIDGNCAYAVIPQENTLGGPVYDYVDELLSREGISIAGEIELPIRQALIAAEGTGLEDIKTVYSHTQGIIQGAAWLAENLPHAEVIEVSSTAEGARMVSESDAADCAAIASTGAADVYGLQVLAESIQQNEANKTRFYVLSPLAPMTAANDRMLFSAAGDAAWLPGLMEMISECGMQLISIHDRPEKTELGRYVYLIECENAGHEDYLSICGAEGFEFNYYGSFPVIAP